MPMPSSSQLASDPHSTHCATMLNSEHTHSPACIKLSAFQVKLRTLLAGGLAGCMAKTIIAPFDRVKILFQVKKPEVSKYSGKLDGVFKTLRFIFERDGLYGLYRGHSAMLVRIFPYAGFNFLSYEYYKQIFSPFFSEHSSIHKLVCGSLAGATSVSLTYPLDLMRSRLAYQLSTTPSIPTFFPSKRLWFERILFGQSPIPRFGSVWKKTISSVVITEGSMSKIEPMRLYRGFSASLCGIIPYAGVSFCTFETLKGFFGITSENDNIFLKLVCGFVAGICGQTAAYPLDVVRRRMQLDTIASHIPIYRSIRSALVDIVKQSGFRGLYIGISINYLKVAPATAISFVTFESLKKTFYIDNESIEHQKNTNTTAATSTKALQSKRRD